MGEISDEGLEEHLEAVIRKLNNSWVDRSPYAPYSEAQYVEEIKKAGWVPATHVARSRALMEDAQRELAQEKAKNAALEEEIRALREDSARKPPQITITTGSISSDKIAAGAIQSINASKWGSIFSGLA